MGNDEEGRIERGKGSFLPHTALATFLHPGD